MTDQSPESIFAEAGGATVVKLPNTRANGAAGPDADRQEQKKANSGERVISVLTPAECEVGEARPYVIKGLIARGDHAQFIGLPGSGKSALAPLAGYSIALGIPFLGRRVKKGLVLYLAAEDGHGMKLRVRALRKRLGDTTQFLLVPEALNLMDPNSGDIDRVTKLIRKHRPVAVFIDTVARAFPGLRENESDSMGRVVAVARAFAAEECRPAVVTVHHVAKDAGITPRGHGVLAGDLDVVVLVQGEKAELRSVALGKNRNGASDATFAFNIEIEDFGKDEDGDLITAPIAAPIEAFVTNRKSEAEARLSDAATLMLREIRDLMDRNGTLTDLGGDHPKVLSVSRVMLRSRLIDRGWFADHLLSVDKEGNKQLTRAGYGPEAIALKSLKRRSIISHNQQYVWLL
jgi:predicted ATP-dependent serine protease